MSFVADHDCYERAAALIAEHGAFALAEAAQRAATGRARDNPFAFAHWRRVGRTVMMILDEAPRGTLH